MPPRLPPLPPLFSAITPLAIAARIFLIISFPSAPERGIKRAPNLILPDLKAFILTAFLFLPLSLFLPAFYIAKIMPLLFIN
jgi:hypothetical protein